MISKKKNNAQDLLLKRLSPILNHMEFTLLSFQVRYADENFDALLRSKDGIEYLIECKSAWPFRSNTFRGMLADSFLRKKGTADSVGKKFLLIITVDHITQMIENLIRDYTKKYTSDLNWLLITPQEYLINILSEKNQPKRGELNDIVQNVPYSKNIARVEQALFTPKKQWLLKSLLLPGISKEFWAGPENRPTRLTELSQRTNISLGYASMFGKAMESSEYLRRERGGLYPQNIEKLMSEWVRAPRPDKNVYMAEPIYPYSSAKSFTDAILEKIKKRSKSDLYALSSHAACEIYGVSITNVNTIWLYCGGSIVNCLKDLDLTFTEKTHGLVIRIIETRANESIFIPRVEKDGLPLCDILQVYLDVSASAARGEEQADAIMNKILFPHLTKGQNQW